MTTCYHKNHKNKEMSRRWINMILLLALAIITAVVIIDYLSTRPGKRPPNPFSFDISEYESVDEEMISYREVRQIRTGEVSPVAITFHKNNILLLTGRTLQQITLWGEETGSFSFDHQPVCLAVTPQNNIAIAFEQHLALYSQEGVLLYQSEPLPPQAYYTAIAPYEDKLFVADAGNRRVVVYNERLEQINSFRGVSGVSEVHGFILPGAHFDLALNHENELWIVNPGLHRLQLYGHDGRFRREWGFPSFSNEGFSGCCNPSYIAFFADGRMATSEKGLVRIKIHKESGELESVAVPPNLFAGGKQAPAIAVSPDETIIALDFDKNMIRIFEPR